LALGRTVALTSRKYRRTIKRRIDTHLWIFPMVTFFIAWEGISRAHLIPTEKMPAFSTVIATLTVCASNWEFLYRVFQSFLNLSLGIFLALFIAMPLALCAGLRNKFDATFTPIIMIVGALPDLAILPVLVIWFGSGNMAAIVMASVCAFFPVYYSVREGTKDIPHDYFNVATVFRSGKIDTFRKVIFPATFPYMVTGLRISFDFVWEVILAIEIIARVTGIGTFIDASVNQGTIEYAFAGIMAVGAIALSVDRVAFGLFEGRIRRWKE